MSLIHREKLAQASKLLNRCDADVWITYVRETTAGSDPILPLLIEGGLTWQSALIVSKSGKTLAIVGNYDADPLIHSGDWDQVIPYVQDIKPHMLEELSKLMPKGGTVAVNYSPDDVMSDGISHGMFLNLRDMLADQPYEIISATPVTMALRGQKSPAELARVRDALVATDEMFSDIKRFATPGVTERAVYDLVHELAARRNLGFSWDPAGDPIVNSGPDSMIGHGIPSDSIKITEGHIFHVDLGLTLNGYSSDIQRSWYVGQEVPDDVAAAFNAVRATIEAAKVFLKPGILGWEVDAVARQTITAAGYPEYQHALGHQVGIKAHDGGAILGPEWPRYGNTPRIPVERHEVYTIELGVTLPGRGYLGLEEMVVVTESGCEYLLEPQSQMMLI